jgi:hypothetical protein
MRAAIKILHKAVDGLVAFERLCSKKSDLQSSLVAAEPGMTLAADNAAAAGTNVGLSANLAACLQDCVRLGVTAELLQPLWSMINGLCTIPGSQGVEWSTVLACLTGPPGSNQQQQLFQRPQVGVRASVQPVEDGAAAGSSRARHRMR